MQKLSSILKGVVAVILTLFIFLMIPVLAAGAWALGILFAIGTVAVGIYLLLTAEDDKKG